MHRPTRPHAPPLSLADTSPGTTAAAGTGFNIQSELTSELDQVLHQRRFLQRNHSIDMMTVNQGMEEEESGREDLPPNLEEESVLQPLAFASIEGNSGRTAKRGWG